jgi:hypothetical protein
MKTPRIQDFDPEAAERQLSTPLDGMPVIEKPRPRPQVPVVRPTESVNGQKNRSQVAKQARPLVRRTFDFYEDQIEYLTTASLQARLAGRGGSMNAMIREAIDLYMAQKTSEK